MNERNECRILVVDDDSAFRDSMRRLLWVVGQSLPMQVQEAADGTEAMRAIKEDRIDCVLLDHRMPGRTGTEWIVDFLEADRNLAIIMVTGEGDEQAAVNAMKNGAMDYLVKGTIMADSIQRAMTNALEKRAMRQMSGLLERTGALGRIGGWEVNPATLKLKWTLATFQITDIEPPNEPTLEEGINLFAPGARPIIMAAVKAATDNGTPFDLELPVITAKGRHIWVKTQGFPEMRDGRTILLFGTFQDITERKLAAEALVRAEEERQQTLNQLVFAQKLESIGVLASGVAHEINNPIMGIMGYAQIIVDRWGAGDADLLEYATEIGKETERVSTIVQNLLSFARQDNEHHRGPARLHNIVEATLSLIRVVLRHDQIALGVDVPAELPPLTCNSQQIQQVIMNLLTNARDALNQRYPGHDADKLVRISARELSRAGRRVPGGESTADAPTPDTRPSTRVLRLTVEDHGTGIPEALRARIFEPFFTTKPRLKGTGLGLSISYGIVKTHGGELSVESEPGHWTRFHLDLPVE